MNYILNYSTQSQSVDFELSTSEDLHNEAYTFIFERILNGYMNITENDILNFLKHSNRFQYKKLTAPIDTPPETLYNMVRRYFYSLPNIKTYAMIRLVVPKICKTYINKFKFLTNEYDIYQETFSSNKHIILEFLYSELDY